MVRFFLKITVLLITVMGNTVSSGMMFPFHPDAEQIQHNPDFIEGVFVQAQTDNIPLYHALTPRQLLVLADKRFNESMPESPVECNSLYRLRDNEFFQKYQETKLIEKYKIDRLQEERMAIFCALPSNLAQKKIYDQFKQMVKRLSDDECCAWINFIEDSAKRYGFRVQTIPSYSLIKKHCSIILMQEWMDGRWDERLPEVWRSYVAQAMKENGINPYRINLLSLDELNTMEGVDGEDDGDDGDDVAVCSGPYFDKSATIALNRKQCKLNYSIDEQQLLKFTAYHIVMHIVCGHAAMQRETVNAIIRSCYAYEFIHQSQLKQHIGDSVAYCRFALAMERSADVLSALQNSELAECARKCGNIDYSSLYSGSYNYVAVADANWQMLKSIQEVSAYF